MSPTAHFIYFALWVSFGVGHTLLACPKAKTALNFLLGRTYRFSYNLFALLHIGLVIYGGRYLLGAQASHFALSPEIVMAMQGSMLLGIILFLIALSQYDIGRFVGLTQLFTPAQEDREEPLHLGGLHRFVRHPLYTGVYLYMWGAVHSELDLATALYASLYLMIGSHFEERKLIDLYGTAYSDYKKRVPALIPWRGRAI